MQWYIPLPLEEKPALARKREQQEPIPPKDVHIIELSLLHSALLLLPTRHLFLIYASYAFINISQRRTKRIRRTLARVLTVLAGRYPS
jgi:hypothetical protein